MHALMRTVHDSHRTSGPFSHAPQATGRHQISDCQHACAKRCCSSTLTTATLRARIEALGQALLRRAQEGAITPLGLVHMRGRRAIIRSQIANRPRIRRVLLFQHAHNSDAAGQDRGSGAGPAAKSAGGSSHASGPGAHARPQGCRGCRRLRRALPAAGRPGRHAHQPQARLCLFRFISVTAWCYFDLASRPCTKDGCCCC